MAEYVTLIARDGQRVVLPKDVAMASGTLQGLAAFSGASGSSASSASQQIAKLPGVDSGALLETAAAYLMYRDKHAQTAEAPAFDVPSAMALELLVVADYLDL